MLALRVRPSASSHTPHPRLLGTVRRRVVAAVILTALAAAGAAFLPSHVKANAGAEPSRSLTSATRLHLLPSYPLVLRGYR